jgi:hypothetical protein
MKAGPKFERFQCLGWFRACAVVIAGALFANGFLAAGPGAAAASPTALSGVHIFGWGFTRPYAVASNGADVWVLNSSSLVEVSTATGRLVRAIWGSGHEFSNPEAIAADGAHVWVTNTVVTNPYTSYDGSVAEINVSDGRLVRLIRGSSYDFESPEAIASDGAHVWVANLCGNASATEGCIRGSVTELSASTGRLVRVISGSTYQFNSPEAIATGGGYVWVANTNGDSVTELRSSDGSLVRVIPAVANEPGRIAADRTHVWVVNRQPGNGVGGSITEIATSTGRVVRVIAAADGGFFDPIAIASDAVHVWVLSQSGNRVANYVTELSASTGRLVKVITGSRYAFDNPDAVVSDGTHVWVANVGGGHGMTEISTSTGALIRLIRGSSYGFAEPDAVATDGAHIWVANGGIPGFRIRGANSLAELNASNGRLVRVISGRNYRFDHPDAVTVTDGHVWVANGGNDGNGGNSVTEVDASNGALVRVMSGPSYQLNWPTAIASDGAHVWVANTAGDSVTELDASTGHLVGVKRVGRYPDAIASDGAHIWVASQWPAGADEGPPGSVTELDASTGNVVRTISDSSYQLNFPVAITSDGTHVWVANYYRKTVSGPYFNSVTEFSASTGRLIKVISGSSYEFNQPDSMASDGTHVWVVNNGGAAEAPNNSITELNAATGDLVRVMSASTYGLSGPESICVQGTHVWVANGDGQSVTEFPAG